MSGPHKKNGRPGKHRAAAQDRNHAQYTPSHNAPKQPPRIAGSLEAALREWTLLHGLRPTIETDLLETDGDE